ncbi:hypothetical protein [Neobacillus sp. 114]|uniref:hypothetical protein n=1 Tax=Neobacillus sp. 114 TaxID=3048535 RepID=UPI001C22D20D|nr:hypothetical protein [Neobacillus sp. 114]MBU8915071.1 hypothetical protein [Bacillus sp. FJAT-29953]
MEKTFLVIVGEQISSKEWRLKRKPNFIDVFILSRQLSNTTLNPSYQYIPLENGGIMPINFCDQDFQIIYIENKIQILVGENEILEEEIFEILSHFVLVEGTKVTALRYFPFEKTSLLIRIKRRTASAEKKLKDTSDCFKLQGGILRKL